MADRGVTDIGQLDKEWPDRIGQLVEWKADAAKYLRVFRHVGFSFCRRQQSGLVKTQRLKTSGILMERNDFTMTEHIAHVVRNFQQRQTGHAPRSVTVNLSEGTLVITLHEALTNAEKALSQTASGAGQVREYHRQLFQSAVEPLRAEIERITGVTVREATEEVETTTGAVVQVLSTGAIVQVFQLAGGLSAESWNGCTEEPSR